MYKLKRYELYRLTGYFIFAIILSLILLIVWGYSFLSGLRAILGLAYVLFLPGYIVVRFFFNEEKLDWIEKMALSMGLSIALVILSVMFSNMILGIPIIGWTNFLVILFVMIITAILKIYQKEISNFFNIFKFWKH